MIDQELMECGPEALREMVVQLEEQVREFKALKQSQPGGNLEDLKLDYSAGVAAELAELQRIQTAQKYLVSTVRMVNGVEFTGTTRFCSDDARLVEFIGQLSLEPNLAGFIRVSMIDERGWVEPFYGNEPCDLRTQEELAEFLDDYVNADGSIKQ